MRTKSLDFGFCILLSHRKDSTIGTSGEVSRLQNRTLYCLLYIVIGVVLPYHSWESVSRNMKLLRFLLISTLTVLLVAAGDDESSSDSDMRKARHEATPAYLRPVLLLGMKVQPVTIAMTVLCGMILFRGMTKKSTATASHILIDDTSEKGKEKLEKLKKEIGDDPDKFGEAAREHSKCPSGKSARGNLGSFGQGSMVPGFDRLVFNPETEVGKTVGPVQTHFGWHLIFIHKRSLA